MILLFYRYQFYKKKNTFNQLIPLDRVWAWQAAPTRGFFSMCGQCIQILFFWVHCSCVPTLLFAWKAFSKMKRCTLNFAPFFFLSVVFFQKSIVIWNLKVFLQGFDFVNCQRGLVLDASSWPLYLYLYVFDFPISILEWQPFKTCPLYDFYLNNQLKHDP